MTELVAVWTVAGLPVRVVIRARRYRVMHDPAPLFIPGGLGEPEEWDLELLSLQPPPERLEVTVRPRPDGPWLLTYIGAV